MSRDFRVFLDDILVSIRRIQDYVEDLTFEKFLLDQKTIDAVIRNLEIIGEAARHIPQEVRSMSPMIEWTKIVGLRNIVSHEYFGIDYETVWDVIQNKLPSLEQQIRIILNNLS